MTRRSQLEARSGDLVNLMGDLKTLHSDMLSVLQQKLAGMRRADTEAINSCTARERFLAERVQEREGLRRQLVQILGKELGLSPEQSAGLGVRDLAERLPEPRRGQLLVLGEALRELIGKIDNANKVVALVTGEMLKHFRHVYAAMARSGPSTGRYASNGQIAVERPTQVFDAVG